MSTTDTRHFALTMLLGLVMATGIALLGPAELAWLGFAMAGMLRSGRTRA
ncbi:MAG TPA: hypothetical protein VF533_16590 [Solirubrobacteraceae bacterium]|jgi:hypothetical protein